jgi:TRAP-type C4-dicarboxylate transport system permease small subunit
LPRWLEQLRASIGWLGGVGVLLLLVNVLVDVTSRYLLNRPIPGTIEYVSFWYMVAIAFFGLAVAERDDEHIDAPIVFDRLPAVVRRELTVFSKVLFIVVLLAMAWWGLEEATRQYAVRERGGAAGVPVWPTRFFVPVGAVACAAEVAIRLVRSLRGEPQPTPQSTPQRMSPRPPPEHPEAGL